MTRDESLEIVHSTEDHANYRGNNSGWNSGFFQIRTRKNQNARFEQLRLGLSLLGNLTLDQMVNLATEAEKMNFESVWVAEGTGTDAFAASAVIAQNTSKIRIGTDIVSIYTRHPCVLVSAAASLDVISKGRFRLGLGASHSSIVEKQLGLKYSKPVKRIQETIQLIRSILVANEPASYLGKIFTVSNYSLWFKPFKPDLQIYVAAGGPRMIEVLAKQADGSLFFLKTVKALSSSISTVREISAAEGRQVDIGVVIPCAFHENVSLARKSASMTLAMYISEYETYQKSLTDQGFSEEVSKILLARKSSVGNPEQFVTPRLIDDLCLCGSTEDIGIQMSRFEEAGVDLLILEPCYLPDEEYEDTVRRTIRLSEIHDV